ncbi:MAG: BACON domain-containing protein [Bacteroidales bacterium]|nr:BACON domain-containing protein [Bacteroidales bacterium]
MKKTLIFVVCMMMLAACSQDTTLSISSDISSYRFDADGGAFDAIIFTNGSWTASCDDPSVTFTPDAGYCTTPMHISIGANEEYFTKSVRITLNTVYGSYSRTGKIVLTQDCRPFIFCEQNRLDVTAAGGKARFQVNANESWKVVETTCDGVKADLSVDPSVHGPNKVEVTVAIPANTTGLPRSFAVKLALEAHPDCSVVLTVGQEA